MDTAAAALHDAKPRIFAEFSACLPQILHVASDMPEQTEPEDLSMHSPRSAESHEQNEDIDLDDLDDAAALYMRQQHH